MVGVKQLRDNNDYGFLYGACKVARVKVQILQNPEHKKFTSKNFLYDYKIQCINKLISSLNGQMS